MTATTERDFQRQVVELATLCRWRVYHTYDSRRSNPGFPDLVLVRDGIVVFAELKNQAGRLTDDQREWLAALTRVATQLEDEGANPRVQVYCWRPADWPEIERLLGAPK
jgi:hypothetical protein